MSKPAELDYVKIRREEYTRLKKLQKYFEGFWGYLSHLQDIDEARKEVKQGKVISQEDLFQKFGV